VVYILIST